MGEIKTILCPNCGANTTNAQNCEYCGSLLVRFVDKGIDLSKTSYLNNDEVIPGLIDELGKNLKLQYENPNEGGVVTDVYFHNTKKGWRENLSIVKPGECVWLDDSKMGFEKKEGFLITIEMTKILDDGSDEYNQQMEKKLSRFKNLDSYPLFTSHLLSCKDEAGNKRYGPEYAIDFGTDVEGAARLISEIWYKVLDHSADENPDFLTNVGVDNIEKARQQWDEAHGFAIDKSGCIILCIIAQIIGLLLWWLL